MTATAASTDRDPPLEAFEHFIAGRLDTAAEICRNRLAEEPSHVGALRLLANVMVRAGQGQLATLMLEQALKALPDDAVVLADLGAALAATGSSEEAAAAFLDALGHEPDNVDAFFGLLDLGRRGELDRALSEAIDRRPDDPAPRFALANSLLEAGRRDAASDSYARAVELEEKYSHRHAHFGRRLAFRALPGRARQMYEWGLAVKPADPELLHLRAALDGGYMPARASDGYVADHFDAFADKFDEKLVGQLGYRAPELVVDALRRWLPDPSDLAILDAGCGTGLCGPLLRPLSARLAGVDLSKRMLDRARDGGQYDELRHAELVAALRADHAVWDAIVSADVLIYFGDLEEIFRAARAALRPGGLLVASMERQDAAAYVLRESGRYAHSPEYVTEVAAESGLIALELQDCVPRLELGQPVPGQIAVLRAPF